MNPFSVLSNEHTLNKQRPR